MNFEDYLKSKRIDSVSFRASEEVLWENWKNEFDQLSPTSFTAQKLYLINPIRRKYQLKEEIPVNTPKATPPNQTETKTEAPVESHNIVSEKPAPTKPAVPRPVFRPKPKMN